MKDAYLYPLAAVGIGKGIYEVYVKPELSMERAVLALGVTAVTWLGVKAIQADMKLFDPR
jgi:hypothetical protein